MAATEYLKFVFGTLLVIACLSLVIFYVNPSYLMKRSPTQNPTTGGQASPFYAARSIPAKIGDYEVEELAPGETAGGVYSWNDEPLGPCPDCDEIIMKINAGRVLSPEHEAFISSNLGENRVYVGLTTSPRRVKNVHHIFKNLDLKHVENILLTLPHGYRNKEPYSISRKLVEAFPKVKVLAVPTDFGGATKIIHAMEWVRKTRGALADGDVVISIDDDNGYATNMLGTMVYHSLKYKHAVFAPHARNLEDFGIPNVGYPRHPIQHVPAPGWYPQIVEGDGAIAYHGRQLDVEMVKSMSQNNTACRLSDDLMISVTLAYYGVQLFALPRPSLDPSVYDDSGRADFNYFEDTDALHLLNPDGTRGSGENTNNRKYQVCYKHVQPLYLRQP